MQYNPSRYEVDKKTGFFTIGYGAGSSPTFTNLTVTGTALFADGTPAAPAIAFSADTDTGICRVGPNEIGFVTNGTERASFISQGLKLSNVGGSFTLPNVFANGDQDTGLATIGGNQLALVVGGATALSFNNSVNATFGGNLTVSGTGSFTQTDTSDTRAITLTSGTLKSYVGGFSNGATYITSNWYYSSGSVIPDATRTTSSIVLAQSTSANAGTIDFNIGNVNTSPATLMRLAGNGNLLLSTTIDGGNGKLQLATGASDKTSGIGFSSDTSLYRTSAGCLRIDNVSGSNALLALADSGVTKAQFQVFSGDLYIDSNTAGKSIVLRSGNAATALTLDSSQRMLTTGMAAFGGTTFVSLASWANGSSGFGENNLDKAVIGHLKSATNGAIIAGHTWTLNNWANLNIAGNNLYFRTNGEVIALTISSSQNATFAAGVDVGAATYLAFTNRSAIRSSADGLIRLTNWADTDFTRLQFGGTTASFPALGRNGNALDCLLADSSGYANIRAERFVIASGTVQLISGTNSPEGVITANVGSLFLRTNGGASTTLYVKESGTGNTGWVAK